MCHILRMRRPRSRDSGLPMTFKDRTELLEPKTLNDAIKKLKHSYEKTKRRLKNKSDWKAKNNDRNKKKWPKKIMEKKGGTYPSKESLSQQKFDPDAKGHAHKLATDQHKAETK